MSSQTVLASQYKRDETEEVEMTEEQKEWLRNRAREAYLEGRIPIDWLERFLDEDEVKFLESLQN